MLEKLPPITGNDPEHPTAAPHDHAFWKGQTCHLCTSARDSDRRKLKAKKARVKEEEIGRILNAYLKERDGKTIMIVEVEATGSGSDAFFRELQQHGLSVFVELPEEAAGHE